MSKEGLKGNARKFGAGAEKLREQEERKASGAKASVEHAEERANSFGAAADLNERKASGTKASVEHAGERANNFVDAAADLNAKVYSEARIMPEIDSLVNAHTDGKPISREKLEATYKKVMSNMVEDGILTQKEMDAYTAPQKIEKTVKVKVEDPNFGQKVGAFFSRENEVFEKRKVIENGPSQFQKDIASSMQFNKQGKVDAPNLASLKDKVLYGVSQICANLGFSSLSKACRNAISVDNQENINKIEAGAVDMVKKVTKQAKEIGNNIERRPEAARISKQTQNIVAKRQKQDSSRIM